MAKTGREIFVTQRPKILPCPFCGGTAEVLSADWKYQKLSSYVKCRKCGIATKAYVSIANALSAWNMRVAPQCQTTFF